MFQVITSVKVTEYFLRLLKILQVCLRPVFNSFKLFVLPAIFFHLKFSGWSDNILRA